MISSSASPICCDCLLSITYFGQMPSSASPILARCPPQHHLFWPDALLSITYALIAACDLLLSITYFLGGPLPQHHLFFGGPPPQHHLCLGSSVLRRFAAVQSV